MTRNVIVQTKHSLVQVNSLSLCDEVFSDFADVKARSEVAPFGLEVDCSFCGLLEILSGC
jgi:hypothetical protein